MLSSKDLNFVGYTYKNFEIVNDYQVPGMGNLALSYAHKNIFYLHETALSCIHFQYTSVHYIHVCVGSAYETSTYEDLEHSLVLVLGALSTLLRKMGKFY